jgi:hypothetical protein
MMLRLALATVLAVAVVSVARPARAELEVVMLDPDANLSNLARLRKAMLGFLRTIDPAARFTTFTKRADRFGTRSADPAIPAPGGVSRSEHRHTSHAAGVDEGI